jgi:NADPH:quinone reductase-like Zn-dependent oxidoreductase
MKAIIHTRYGPPDVLRLAEIDKPVPKDGEILVKVAATLATIGDCRMRSFRVSPAEWLFARLYLGVLGPRRQVLGMALAGDVEATGLGVTQFQPGDAVMASTFSANFGAYAEYKCLQESGMVVRKPPRLSYPQAAALLGGSTAALRCLRKAGIERGQRVLIYGASGAVGAYAVQLARWLGAEVTGVCSTANLALVQSLGATRVIDYTQEDFTQGSERYDVIFDAVHKLSPAQGKRALGPGGVYLDVDSASGSGEKKEELLAIVDLAEKGLIRPVIDCCYELDRIVEAHRYVEQGHKRGNVVITVGPTEERA